MCSRRTACGPEFSIPGFQDTKWWVPWMKLAPVSLRGRRNSVSESAGTVATTTRAGSAGAEIFAIAGIRKLPASAMTVDTKEYMVAPAEALVAIPDTLSDV